MATTASQRDRPGDPGPSPPPRGRGPRGSVPSSPPTRAVGRPSRRGPRPTHRARAARASAAGSPPTSAIGRCSIAPAAALVAAGVTWTDRCFGRTMPVRAGALGAAQQSAQVARVGHAVEGDEERRTAARSRTGQVVEVGLGQLGGVGHHALGRVGAGLRLEPTTATPPAPARGPPPRARGCRRAPARDRGRRRAGPRAPAAGRPAAARAPPGGPRPGRHRGPRRGVAPGGAGALPAGGRLAACGAAAGRWRLATGRWLAGPAEARGRSPWLAAAGPGRRPRPASGP